MDEGRKMKKGEMRRKRSSCVTKSILAGITMMDNERGSLRAYHSSESIIDDHVAGSCKM